jgi:hypothetical protein
LCRRFGDIHNRAIDEIWYKRAVEQHYMDEESFVYSVPFYDDDAEGKKILFQNLPVIGVKSNFFCILHLSDVHGTADL